MIAFVECIILAGTSGIRFEIKGERRGKCSLLLCEKVPDREFRTAKGNPNPNFPYFRGIRAIPPNHQKARELYDVDSRVRLRDQ